MQRLWITAPLTSLILLAGTVGVATTSTSEVLVLRGNSVESIKSITSKRAVLRGVPSRSIIDRAAPGQTEEHLRIGGKRIWLVDGRTGTIISCGIRGTGIVGKSRVYCITE
jgi:hypothetical protein